MERRSSDQHSTKFLFSRYVNLFVACGIVGIGICTFGIDNGETSGFLAMQPFLRDFGYLDPTLGYYSMTAGDQTRMYGIELGFALVGGLVAGFIGTNYGRKIGLFIAATLCMLGAGLQMISHVPGLLVGRAVMGAGIGSAGVLSIAYWSEVTPVQFRGPIVVFFESLVSNIATFVGACVNQGSHNNPTAMAYRIPLTVATIVPFFLFILIWLVPESPRWLVTRGRNDQARHNLRRIRGKMYSEEELDHEMKDTIAFTAIELELEASSSFWDCFTGTDLRRTVIGVVLFTGGQLMGVGFLGGYLTYFFVLIGYTDAFAITVISSACAIAGSLSSLFTIRYFGRRPILIAGAAVNAFCMLAFSTIGATASYSTAGARAMIAFICIFTFTFSASWGPVVPTVSGEIPSNKLRSKTLAVSMAMQWATSMLIICGAPYLIDPQYANIGTKIGFIFGGLTIPVLVFVIFFVPETKDRTLEEIDEMFLNKVPSLKFKSYVCTGRVQNISADAVLQSIQRKEGVVEIESVEG